MYSPFQTEHPNMSKINQNQSQSKHTRHNFRVRCWEASDSSSAIGSSQKGTLLSWIIIIGLQQPKTETDNDAQKWSTRQHNDKDSTFIPHEDTESPQLVDYGVIRCCPSQIYKSSPKSSHHNTSHQTETMLQRNTTMKTIPHEMAWHDNCADLLTSLDTTQCPVTYKNLSCTKHSRHNHMPLIFTTTQLSALFSQSQDFQNQCVLQVNLEPQQKQLFSMLHSIQAWNQSG